MATLEAMVQHVEDRHLKDSRLRFVDRNAVELLQGQSGWPNRDTLGMSRNPALAFRNSCCCASVSTPSATSSKPNSLRHRVMMLATIAVAALVLAQIIAHERLIDL